MNGRNFIAIGFFLAMAIFTVNSHLLERRESTEDWACKDLLRKNHNFTITLPKDYSGYLTNEIMQALYNDVLERNRQHPELTSQPIPYDPSRDAPSLNHQIYTWLCKNEKTGKQLPAFDRDQLPTTPLPKVALLGELAK